MSPTKKKARKAPAKKAPAKKATAKKATAKKATAQKAAAKKAAAKKATAKKATAKKATAQKATAKKAAAKKAAAKKAAAKKATAQKAAAKKAKQKPAPKGKPVPLSKIPHPKYGLKFECFSCATRFYVMGKPEPICPNCGADQRERPKEASQVVKKPKRAAVRPMAPLLDDDEDVAVSEVDKGNPLEPSTPDAMFDDAETASTAEDADEAPRRKAATEEDDS